MNKIKIMCLFVAWLLSVHTGYSQSYHSENGHVWFYSHTPIEEIEAHNLQVSSSLNIDSGKISFIMFIHAFEFEIPLMKEHFNENYLESGIFPSSYFSGTFSDPGDIDITSDGIYRIEVRGNLTIHGVTRNITVTGTLQVKQGSIIARSKFTVRPKDYDIRIPAVVENSIAREIEVHIDITYSQISKPQQDQISRLPYFRHSPDAYTSGCVES
ncbi:MAG: YceI family protein [Bacteroidales bacterium]|nr:YceI family protein [Bacteroidales bacterium]